jgi:hypothetical protein
MMTTKPKTRKAPAPAGINPKLIALAAKINKANALAEEHGTYDAVFKLEDGLAAIAAVNLEELKLKARYVDADCIVGLDKQIGPLLASIIRDLRALAREPKGQHVRHV